MIYLPDTNHASKLLDRGNPLTTRIQDAADFWPPGAEFAIENWLP